MKIPTLHLNGTSYESLSGQIETAVRAVRAAEEAMREAEPHDRDYYLQGAGAGRQAREEHLARVTKLVEVRSEMESIFEDLDRQHEARAKR